MTVLFYESPFRGLSHSEKSARSATMRLARTPSSSALGSIFMERPNEALLSRKLFLSHYPSLRLFCGLGVALLGAAAFLGWLTGMRALASIGSTYIPMAPNTALAFVVLGTALAILVRTPSSRWTLETARLAAGLVAVLASLRLCEF